MTEVTAATSDGNEILLSENVMEELRSSLTGEYLKRIQGKFPFERGASQVVGLQDVVRVFGAESGAVARLRELK